MITLQELYRTYTQFRDPPDNDQKQAVEAGPDDPLFLVAGPGSGKTTCITLRIFKLVFVDGVPPGAILATTFTKKAAAELRSRILGWGFQLMEELDKDTCLSVRKKDWVKAIDINQVVTGTIDSICEQALRDHRDPGMQPPVLVDDFVAKTLLLRAGLLDGGRYQDSDLDSFLLDLHGGSTWGYNLGRKTDLVRTIWDRRYQDQVNWGKFIQDTNSPHRSGRKILDEAQANYAKGLSDDHMVDFAVLEQDVLERLQAGRLKQFQEQFRVVLVDEYQDTNLLQEAIYFELAKGCRGALTVVGDDDQSLYRFRGATVELFSSFPQRYHKVFKRTVNPIFLRTNYRSTRRIITLVDNFVKLDRSYQSVRVEAKPALVPFKKAPGGLPVLAMFRNDLNTLAQDLSQFIHRIFRGKGFPVPGGDTIRPETAGGDLGDCALLCSSPAETKQDGTPRLPLLLRQKLVQMRPSIEVFNPRGQDMSSIEIVQLFGGLLLECLDPEGLEATTSGLGDVTDTFRLWRDAAVAWANGKAAPKELKDYCIGWADRDPNRKGYEWPRSVPVLDLIYDLMHFFPQLHDNPEGQVYLEVFTRQASACEQIGKFRARVVTDPSDAGLSEASVRELLRYLFAPIASGAVGVDEELMGIFPRDRLSVLSTHQAKGLEFPMTIVDIGSDFKVNHRGHAFKRFPDGGGPPHRMEDLLRPYTSLAAHSKRSGRDRAFDDLYRLFFVAYSRPQQVLLLVGLNAAAPSGAVPNVAAGWTRDGQHLWDPSMFLLI